jgi:adenylate kinase family enzyme
VRLLLDAAVYLYAPEEVLTRRLLGRASEGGRADDVADVIEHRLPRWRRAAASGHANDDLASIYAMT